MWEGCHAILAPRPLSSGSRAVGSSLYEFGPFTVQPDERLLLQEGRPVSLTPKAFDLLIQLIDRPGQLVGKQELMTALWPDTFVEETNLAYTMSALRRAIGDGLNGNQYIQTVPTRGYRFVSPVMRKEPAVAITADRIPPGIARSRWHSRRSRSLRSRSLDSEVCRSGRGHRGGMRSHWRQCS